MTPEITKHISEQVKRAEELNKRLDSAKTALRRLEEGIEVCKARYPNQPITGKISNLPLKQSNTDLWFSIPLDLMEGLVLTSFRETERRLQKEYDALQFDLNGGKP